MKEKQLARLSRRERQIMDVVFARGPASAAEILEALDEPPSYSTVRTQLRVLEEKGFLRHREQGPRYIYYPTIAPSRARVSALRHVVRTFFNSSTDDVVATLMDISGSEMTDEDYRRLSAIIERSRKEGKAQ